MAVKPLNEVTGRVEVKEIFIGPQKLDTTVEEDFGEEDTTTKEEEDNVSFFCIFFLFFSFLSLSLCLMPTTPHPPQIHPPEAYHPVATSALVKSIETVQGDRWDACLAQIVEPLGFGGERKREANRWCNYTHTGQCSFAGEYQPSIPEPGTAYGHFFLIGLEKTSPFLLFRVCVVVFAEIHLVRHGCRTPLHQGGYVEIWNALGLDPYSSTLEHLRSRGAEVCSLDKHELNARFGGFPSDDEISSTAQQLCFLSAFAFAMLHHGHGLDLDRNFTAVKTMNYGKAVLKVATDSRTGALN
jgi:hypothetical protein